MMDDVIYGVMLSAKIDMQIAGINARNRKTTADSDDYKHHEGVKKSVADFFHLKCLL